MQQPGADDAVRKKRTAAARILTHPVYAPICFHFAEPRGDCENNCVSPRRLSPACGLNDAFESFPDPTAQPLERQHFKHASDELAEYPEAGAIAEDIELGVRRVLLAATQHYLYYRVTENG